METVERFAEYVFRRCDDVVSLVTMTDDVKVNGIAYGFALMAGLAIVAIALGLTTLLLLGLAGAVYTGFVEHTGAAFLISGIVASLFAAAYAIGFARDLYGKKVKNDKKVK
ncbi:MAG: hypothetical protein MJZ81_10820 [Bacteroidales bacterium]|nr:hypothetical protein [Bacteroidales bacterium]